MDGCFVCDIVSTCACANWSSFFKDGSHFEWLPVLEQIAWTDSTIFHLENTSSVTVCQRNIASVCYISVSVLCSISVCQGSISVSVCRDSLCLEHDGKLPAAARQSYSVGVARHTDSMDQWSKLHTQMKAPSFVRTFLLVLFTQRNRKRTSKGWGKKQGCLNLWNVLNPKLFGLGSWNIPICISNEINTMCRPAKIHFCFTQPKIRPKSVYPRKMCDLPKKLHKSWLTY